MKQEAYGIVTGDNGKGKWDQPHSRRRGLRELHLEHRYGSSYRAPTVRQLTTNIDFRLHDLESIRWYLTHPFFTGLCVLKGDAVIFESYASDFSAKSIHSIQSISKTLVFLIAGRLVESGQLEMHRPVTDYLPEIGSGYRHVTVQQVFDMAVLNDYSEDYYDPNATLGELEDAHGWRLLEGVEHRNLREFLLTISLGDGDDNPHKLHDYKTANTDLAAWICERVSGHTLRHLTIEIIEAAGTHDPVFVSTDREGTPFLGGGLHMSLRDLARYGLLLSRGGEGVSGQRVGSRDFFRDTLKSCEQGTKTDIAYYRNFTFSDGTWLGHLGYGGQWLMVYPESGLVIACYSAIEDEGGLDLKFIKRLSEMGQDISRVV